MVRPAHSGKLILVGHPGMRGDLVVNLDDKPESRICLSDQKTSIDLPASDNKSVRIRLRKLGKTYPSLSIA